MLYLGLFIALCVAPFFYFAHQLVHYQTQQKKQGNKAASQKAHWMKRLIFGQPAFKSRNVHAMFLNNESAVYKKLNQEIIQHYQRPQHDSQAVIQRSKTPADRRNLTLCEKHERSVQLLIKACKLLGIWEEKQQIIRIYRSRVDVTRRHFGEKR